MIPLICASILSFNASFTPEPKAWPAFIPLAYGSYEYNLGQSTAWRRSFVAMDDGAITIQAPDYSALLGNVASQQAFTLRAYGQPYDKFEVELRQVPEPVTAMIMTVGLILVRRRRCR